MKMVNTLWIGLLVSGIALAHGDEKHPQAAPEKSAHAAALGQPGDPARVTRTIEVRMDDRMRFTPSQIRVKQGETIRFRVTNRGKVKHEMVLGTLAELKSHAEEMRKFPEMEHDDPNAIELDAGKSGELIWQFTQTGNFDFACLIPGHFEAGMKGTLQVTRK